MTFLRALFLSLIWLVFPHPIFAETDSSLSTLKHELATLGQDEWLSNKNLKSQKSITANIKHIEQALTTLSRAEKALQSSDPKFWTAYFSAYRQDLVATRKLNEFFLKNFGKFEVLDDTSLVFGEGIDDATYETYSKLVDEQDSANMQHQNMLVEYQKKQKR